MSIECMHDNLKSRKTKYVKFKRFDLLDPDSILKLVDNRDMRGKFYIWNGSRWSNVLLRRYNVQDSISVPLTRDTKKFHSQMCTSLKITAFRSLFQAQTA